MFNFLKKKNKNKNKEVEKNTELLSKTASLLIHAAKMDQKYSDEEKEIVRKTMIELGCEDDSIDEMLMIAEKNESDSNQILDFTREIKNTDDNFKIKLIEALWKIIFSDNKADMYESSLMRRLAGLLYLDNKTVGEIKEQIKKK
ncbi:MAG: TerB family tellurite resistance protein [Candidatus Pelagibacter sp.]